MKVMNRMPIAWRVISGFLLSVALLIALTAIALLQGNSTTNAVGSLVDSSFLASSKMQAIDGNVIRIHRAMKDVALSKSPQMLDAAVAAIPSLEATIDADLDVVRQTGAVATEETAAVRIPEAMDSATRVLVLTADLATMWRLAAAGVPIHEVNVGGLHATSGRESVLPYVFLGPEDRQRVRDFEAAGVSRAEVMRRLADEGVGTQVHYIPVHTQPYYRERYGSPRLPGAEAWYARCLSLPLFPGMADDDPDRVVAALAKALS